MTVIFQFSSRLALRNPDITITQPAINPKTMMRLSPFLRGPMKLSKDPVPSAKATSADEQTSSATVNTFRHLRRRNNCLEGNRKFITKHLCNMLRTLTIENYIYFLCLILSFVSEK